MQPPSTPTAVLLVDDDAASLEVLRTRARSWGYAVVTATNGADALEILTGRDAPKLAVLDWMMPGLSGIDVCREVRARSEEYVYIVMLTCRGGRGDVLTALDAGADDYVPKPVTSAELELRLRAGCRIAALQDQLRSLAERDPLVGCWNRRRIIRFLEDELSRARSQEEPFSVVMLDVDNFKNVNDTYGHAGGDAVLRGISRRVEAQLRPYDGWARVGGEEFVIVLPACDADGALAVAERVRHNVERHPFRIPGREVPVTVSLGVATAAPPAYPDTIEHVLKEADDHVYLAKRRGRNRVASGSRSD